MKDIPLKADVFCSDGHAGTTSAIIVNPVKREVTHVVVESLKYLDYLVPLEKVAGTTPDTVQLDCTIEEMHRMRSFTETHYVHDDYYDDPMYQGGQYMSPYATPRCKFGIRPKRGHLDRVTTCSLKISPHFR